MSSPAAPPARTTLVTGGVRSGKSRHAERLLAAHPDVTYVAPGPVPDAEQDPDWTARVAAHRARRPAGWLTRETTDVAAAIAQAPGPVLLDCVGTWLSAVVDDADAWEHDGDTVHGLVLERLAPVLAALEAAPGPVVLVTNEVGLGVVPAYRSGRLFRDLLGVVNQRLGAACDEVHLVVAGRVLVL